MASLDMITVVVKLAYKTGGGIRQLPVSGGENPVLGRTVHGGQLGHLLTLLL